MVKSSVFSAVFGSLREILLPYSKQMVLKYDEVDNFYIDTSFIMTNKKTMCFGSVKINKNYISFHLMPVYFFPKLLENISKELRRRMQGKSCFNFKSVDAELFAELSKLSAEGLERYKVEGYL